MTETGCLPIQVSDIVLGARLRAVGPQLPISTVPAHSTRKSRQFARRGSALGVYCRSSSASVRTLGDTSDGYATDFRRFFGASWSAARRHRRVGNEPLAGDCHSRSAGLTFDDKRMRTLIGIRGESNTVGSLVARVCHSLLDIPSFARVRAGAASPGNPEALLPHSD